MICVKLTQKVPTFSQCVNCTYNIYIFTGSPQVQFLRKLHSTVRDFVIGHETQQ